MLRERDAEPAGARDPFEVVSDHVMDLVRDFDRDIERILTEAKEEAASVRAELAPLRELTLSQAQAVRDRLRVSLVELESLVVEEAEGAEGAEGTSPDRAIVLGEAERAEEQPAGP